MFMGLLLALPALAQAPSMTLKSAIERAITRSPEVLARYNAFKAAEGELEAVAGALLPKVDLTASIGDRRRNEPVFTGSFRENSYGLQLTQLLWDGLTSYYQKRQFTHARAVRLFEFQDASEAAALEAARAYYDVLRYRELVLLAEDNYIQHRAVWQQIDSRVRSGVGRRVDLEQATGRLALSESNLLVESANLHDVAARFQRIVGDVPPRDFEFPASLTQKLPASVTDALTETVLQNPQVRAAVENVRASVMARDSRRGVYDPRLQFRIREDRGNDLNGFPGQTRNQTAELLLNFNIFNGFSDRGRVAQAEGLLGTARDQRDKACRDTRQTTAIAVNDVRKLSEQKTHLVAHRESVEKARDAYRQQFDIGQRSLLDLLDTENEVFQSRRAEANAKIDLETAYVRVHAGMGRLLPVLGLAPLDPVPLKELAEWSLGEDAPAHCPPEQVPTYQTDRAALEERAAALVKSRTRSVSDMVAARAANPALAAPPVAGKPPVVAPAVQTIPPPVGPQAEVAQALKAWAAAWVTRDIGAYLAAYSPEFVPANRQPKAEWEISRARALKRAGIRLQVSAENYTVEEPSRVSVRFVQRYASPGYSDTVEKTLVWRNVDGRWLIEQETAAPLPAGTGTVDADVPAGGRADVGGAPDQPVRPESDGSRPRPR